MLFVVFKRCKPLLQLPDAPKRFLNACRQLGVRRRWFLIAMLTKDERLAVAELSFSVCQPAQLVVGIVGDAAEV